MRKKSIFIIPSRIGSVRLPQKPLEIIEGKTMIEHVCDRVKEANLDFYVATDSEKIESLLESKNIKIIMTNSDLESGTDRVYEAWKKLDNREDYDYIINLQGDMPFIDSKVLSLIESEIRKTEFDILTPVIKVGIEYANFSSNVKVVIDKNNKALYFSRSLIPFGSEEFFYHVGVYAYKREALEKFVSLEKSNYEKSEKLEQLRAIENGITIGVIIVDIEPPISVDTYEDLEKAKLYAKTPR